MTGAFAPPARVCAGATGGDRVRYQVAGRVTWAAPHRRTNTGAMSEDVAARGPCTLREGVTSTLPPAGAHEYEFTLYALASDRPDLPKKVSRTRSPKWWSLMPWPRRNSLGDSPGSGRNDVRDEGRILGVPVACSGLANESSDDPQPGRVAAACRGFRIRLTRRHGTQDSRMATVHAGERSPTLTFGDCAETPVSGSAPEGCRRRTTPTRQRPTRRRASSDPSIASPGGSERTSHPARPTWPAAAWCGHRRHRLVAIPASAGHASP